MGTKDTSNYPTDFMKQLAETRGKNWEGDSREIRRLLKDATATQASFSDIGSLKEFGKVYLAAREVYLETMLGAAQDLEDAAKGISESAGQMEKRDQNAGDAFIKLRDRWDASGLAADERYKEASSRREVQQAANTVQSASEAETATAPTSEEEGAIPTQPSAAGPDNTGVPTDPAAGNTGTGESREGEKEGEKEYSAGRPTDISSPVGK
jgi:hypothetical protein